MDNVYEGMLTDCYREILLVESHINSNPFDSLNPFLISYSVIKACGIIEVVYKSMIVQKISAGAMVEACNYFEKNIIDSSSNPKTGNILRLLEDINPVWKQSFEDRIHSQNEKGSLNSLVNLRNDFAHGRSVTASIGDVKRYYQDARTILTWLDAIIGTT
ncbi:MAG: HEPN domain-containing protein [Oscillospiraceae bacterium]|nr:HEPN domain-containing protein [Oscillospiraceae bacterium]